MRVRRLFLVTHAIFLVTGVSLALGANDAAAAVRHATPTGTGVICDDANPCDLQTAVESAAATDEVVVHPGTYTNADPLDVPAGVSVGSVAGQARPHLEFGAFAHGVGLGDGASIRRMAIDYSGTGSALEGPNGDATGKADRLVIHATADGAVACDPGATLLGNSICWAPGIGGVAVLASDATAHVKLHNVTAVATGTDGIAIRAVAASGQHPWVDAVNVIADGATDAAATAPSDGSADISFENSNYSVTATSGTTAAIHQLGPDNQTTTAPTFVDAAAGDFHEAPTSVTVDAGITVSDSGTKDIDGNDRLIGLGQDIGADEYGEAFARVIGNVAAFAGIDGTVGSAPGPRLSATFEDITGIVHAPTAFAQGALYASMLHDNGVNPATGWIQKVDLSNGQVSNVVTGTFAPTAITYANGVLYVADPGGKVRKVDLSALTPTLTDFATGLKQPEGITSDGTNLYVSENGCGATETSSKISVYPIAGGGATHTTLASFPKPDPPDACNSLNELLYSDGYVYATDRTHLFKVDATTGASTTLIADGLDFPQGLDILGGLLYLTPAQTTGVQMWAVDPATGRYSPNFAGSLCGAGIDCPDRTRDPHMGLGVDVGWRPGAVADDGTSLYVADRLEQGGPTGWAHHMIRQVTLLSDETPPDGSASVAGSSATTTAADGTEPLAETAAVTLPSTARMLTAAATTPEKFQLSLTASDSGSGVRWFQVRSGGVMSAWLPVISSPSVAVYDRAADIRFADRTSNVSAWKAITFPAVTTTGGDQPPASGTQQPADSSPTGGSSVADTTGPVLAVGWKAKQKLGKFVAVTLTCRDEACAGKATGVVTVKRGKKAKRFTLEVAQGSLVAGRALVFKLGLPAKLRKAAAAALKAGGKVTVVVNLTARDAAGNTSKATRAGRLVRR